MGWDDLPAAKRAAATAALKILEDVDVKFVLMVFWADGVGAVLSNIEPGRAIEPMEQALAAAKAGVPAELIIGETLH
jgi:hypothetical protein